ncbi:hypothetical protein SDRG_12519 [Saprolegnia diclina VS20]|uniref:Uncharacterized protein n=1 Tax=Saprolegnia diclina (strain VS20) TaxID=1156394 RepID=T0RIQ5_SAPDV|nr:hypothetical protein SDRG_12519 [Saprolegnia diclina VS20]EQC29747.1 hypothetical protein SDRG_12519 [Saprolegnia diclina VS20]|eukprot:XP_008616813.1 hypothetical protein SDRG_12519 [Saprolegnia diclina VS20]
MTTHRRSLVELVTALRRRSSLSPRQIRIRSRSIMWLFCICKHAVSAVYFVVSGYIYTILSNTERITLNAYQPKLCGSMYFLLAALHVYGVALDMVPTGRRRRRGSLLHSLTMHTRTPHYWLCGFQCAEIGVQSVQAWWLSHLTTNKSLLTTYVSCIILHCLVAPWFILSTIPFFHTTFRLFVNSIIGYILFSGILPGY